MRELFRDSESVPNVWLDGSAKHDDSNVLFTLSNNFGEKTVLVTGGKIIESKASLYVEAPLERVVTGNRKWLMRLSIAGKYFGYVLAAVLITFSALNFTGTVKARIVLTGSMAPSINPGDIILTAPPSRIEPKKGDVVAYTGRRFDGASVGVFSHRIIGGDATNGFIVKGDANPSPDTQHPKIPDITGVVFFTIPFIGKLLTTRSLIVLVPLIFGFWLVIDALRGD